MSSVYLSSQLKERLVQAARRRGFVVERGPQSQLMEYIAYLVSLDEKSSRPRQTASRALGLLQLDDRAAPGDAEVDEALSERRLAH